MNQAQIAAGVDRRLALAGAPEPGSPIAQSWRRSIEVHRLDPGRPAPPRVLPAHHLRDYQAPLEPLLHIARSGMEKLFAQIRDAGYVVLLTDAHGVTVDFMNNPLLDRELRRAGLYLGSCWSEDEEGTCAVGLCTIDRLPVTVHHGEHFRAPNTSLTCSGAPIFAPGGELLAVLDASALFSPDDKRSQHLVLQMVSGTARMIENAHFLRQFEHCLVLRLSARREFLDVDVEGLLALNEEGVIVAANARAQLEFGGAARPLPGLRLEDLFGLRMEDLGRAMAAANGAPFALRTLQSARRYYAQPSQPSQPSRLVRSMPNAGKNALPVAQGLQGPLQKLAGGDAQMVVNANQALRVLDKGIPVMLHGETGTGKEVFAHAMHEASGRAAAPFVALNCAAIPESLIESELFGYRDGAFTGARAKGVRGKITQADGGTLFLDEIGDMPLNLQTRLLRVLAEREVLPLGAEKPVPVDLQVICATHRDLTELVSAGQFRQDLYYRLNGMVLKLPALRERSDKVALIHQLLREEAAAQQRASHGIAENALAVLLHYDWPGNIRQLKNTLRSALALSDDGLVELEHLPADVRCTVCNLMPPPRLATLGFNEDVVPAESAPPVDRVVVSEPTLPNAQAQALRLALKQHQWNIAQTARHLDLCRATVYRRMKRHGIVPPNLRD
ncbi:MAG: sigma-54-dependent Fis family transcriptional regulator [Polaromonas sp.]|uniref:sigma-54-dependent Fis family transcriptional regulator n=1 Tax=Polaromonas sp. TaxID=1869339 RepID=UPI00272F63DC|nr:sigma-54-dependent Fis family transcriptional regulator [Polaromonas sp.]MDP2254954.1 sigma-54-dependent Fis family transcriptional regulator [Polaromonas sp.]